MDAIKIIDHSVYLVDGKELLCGDTAEQEAEIAKRGLSGSREGTIAYSVLNSHSVKKDEKKMQIRFDSLISHDITYVGIIQTARASGLRQFPVPYALTNCHNSLCAVGGTINEDDHVFGLSAAKKYGGIYVPANQAVIHQYAREMMTKCGSMILGSDSHTRYGAMGTMGVGEGGPELVKQLLCNTWDVIPPQVALVYLENAPKKGVGPHDVAIALCTAVFKKGLVTNKVLEFVGPGVKNLSMDFRIGVDVMTTETACLSSIWETDETVKNFYTVHGRPEDYKELKPARVAKYDMAIRIDLSKIESMIALPFHPSNGYTIHELQENPSILKEVEEAAKAQFGDKVNFSLKDKVRDGKIYVDQGVIAGCAGGMFENICEAAAILENSSTGDGYFSLSVYPSSVPVNLALIKNGAQQKLLEAGAVFKPCFCGPCFGAGDVPANNGLSIRHTTRNVPNREGSKPGEGQMSAVALMDARSIAATAANGGRLTAASDMDVEYSKPDYHYEAGIYEKRVYNGWGKADPDAELKFGPNIKDWPQMPALTDDLLVRVCSYITDPVTTTDELIPSGETSSYRSNPERLSEFALFRRDPEYVGRSKVMRQIERDREAGKELPEEVMNVYAALTAAGIANDPKNTDVGSTIFANMPGDGSAREQAASCQRVMGASANFAKAYATKRYRSNCINWGMTPFLVEHPEVFALGDYIFVPGVRKAVLENRESFPAYAVKPDGTVTEFAVSTGKLTEAERQIIADGCLINYYRNN